MLSVINCHFDGDDLADEVAAEAHILPHGDAKITSDVRVSHCHSPHSLSSHSYSHHSLSRANHSAIVHLHSISESLTVGFNFEDKTQL